MAIFPFLLFILTLIPYIPIDGFQEGLFSFIKRCVAATNLWSRKFGDWRYCKQPIRRLLSFGFIIYFLMTNGINSIFSGFEYSYHVKDVRNIFRSYFISIGVSLLLSLFLIVTIASVILYQVALLKIDEKGWFNTSDLDLFYYGKVCCF